MDPSVRRRKDGVVIPELPLRLERRGEGADAYLLLIAGREATGVFEAAPLPVTVSAPAPIALPAPEAPDPIAPALSRARSLLEADAVAILVADAYGQPAPAAIDAAGAAPSPLPIGRGFATLLGPGSGLLTDETGEGPFATLVGIPVVRNGRTVAILQACYHARRDVSGREAQLLALCSETLGAAMIPSGGEPARGEREGLRAAALRGMGSAYSPQIMLQQLVDTLVPRFADWAAADLLETGLPARRAAVAHRDPGLLPLLREMDPAADGVPAPASAHRALRSAQPDVVLEAPLPADGPEDPAWARRVRALGCGSHIVLPLLGRTRLLGAITLVRAAPRRFAEDDVEWVRELVRVASLEAENALLVDHLQRQREAARHATERARLLHGLSSALSEPLTAVQVTEEAVSQARAALAACGGAIAVLSDDHATFEVTALVGEAEALSNASLRFPVHAQVPLADAARSGEMVLLEHVLAGAPRYPFFAHAPSRAQGALCAAPLVVDGRTVGALGLVFPQRRTFSQDDLDFIRSLARLVADALERARLYHAERSARAQADAEARRSVLLADASRILSSSFDYRATLEATARLAVPLFADWCIVYLRENDGTVRALTAVHADPRKALLVRELLWRPAPDPDEPGGVGKVLRQGKPEVFDDIPPSMLSSLVKDPATLDLVRELGLRSQVILPLTARGRTLGAIALCSGTQRRLNPSDLQLVEELARRSAFALDNARLYHEVEDAYRRKQESMSALRESEERYCLLVDGAKDYAIFLLDPQGRIASWNPGAQRLLGYAAEEVVGKSLHLFFTPEEIAERRPERDLEEALRDGRCETEGWRVRKDGQRHWASVVVTVLRDEQGNVRGFSKLHRDVTDRKRAREELDNARQRVAQHEKLSTMGTLVSGVAHEIRTPLTAIANSIHLIRFQLERGSANPDSIGRHTALALEGVDRINQLVQDLRRFKRVDSSGRAPTSLDTVVDEALTLFRAAHRGRVEVAADLQPTPAVEVDRAQIQQAVINLLQNASEALPHGGEVTVRTAPTPEGGAVIVVHDRGVGMSPEVKARMFEEFFTTKPEGTGLGLSIVRRVLELHNGSIECDSDVGQGTTFRLRLPPAAWAARPRST